MMGPDVADFLAQRSVSRETFDRLERYAAILVKWNKTINLVSRSSLDQLWTRHMLDSAQIFDLCPDSATSWADLGSGGGFPGLVVAILAAEKAPNLKITLVESDVRKAAFLSTAVRELGLSTMVLSDRIEAIPPLKADVLSARALAPLVVLCEHAARHLASGGLGIFSKGSGADGEITEARTSWTFDLRKTPSLTDPQAVILAIEGISRA